MRGAGARATTSAQVGAGETANSADGGSKGAPGAQSLQQPWPVSLPDGAPAVTGSPLALMVIRPWLVQICASAPSPPCGALRASVATCSKASASDSASSH